MDQSFARRRCFMIAIALLLSLLPGALARAQIPAEFTNLKILSEDIPRAELVGMMRGFASALGVRCNHCHVGEDPDSLEGYDFASDDKETKRTARVMLRMANAINTEFLPQTGREDLLAVRCATCHHGLERPESIDDVLLAAYETEGVDAALARFRELRDEYFGGAAYDFSSRSLDHLTEFLAMRKRDTEGAMTVNTLNLEYYPDADYTLYLRSRLLQLGGDLDGAVAALEHAIEANPDVEWLKGQLEELRNPPEEPES